MGKREVNAVAHGTTLQKSFRPSDGILWPAPFSKADWEKTPQAVRAYIPCLHQRIDAQDQTIHRLGQRIDDLEAHTK